MAQVPPALHPPSPLEKLLCRLWPFFYILCVVAIGVPKFLLAACKDPHLLRSRTRIRQAFFGAAYPVIAPMIDWWYRPYKIPLLKQAHGVVLDVGPGIGSNLKYLHPSRISKLVLVEPNPGMWPTLRQNVRAAGFRQGQYVICECGAEDEGRIAEVAGIGRGDVDTVTSFLALCSIPDAQRVIASLYAYLKPGGQFLFFEHCRSHDPATRRFQDRLTPTWRFLFFGCELNRPTEKWITEPYDYDEVFVQTVPGTSRFDHSPKMSGWAHKARAPR